MPVPLMELVELISRHCHAMTLRFDAGKAHQGLRQPRLGNANRRCPRFPGLSSSTASLLPMINEAIYTLYEGVGKALRHRCRDVISARTSQWDVARGLQISSDLGHLPVDHSEWAA